MTEAVELKLGEIEKSSLNKRMSRLRVKKTVPDRDIEDCLERRTFLYRVMNGNEHNCGRF